MTRPVTRLLKAKNASAAKYYWRLTAVLTVVTHALFAAILASQRFCMNGVSRHLGNSHTLEKDKRFWVHLRGYCCNFCF